MHPNINSPSPSASTISTYSALPSPELAQVVTHASPLPPASSDSTHIDIGHALSADLEHLLKEVAKNVTDENVHQLASTLGELGIESANDLKRLMSTAQTRDVARSIAASLYIYSGSFGVVSAVVTPSVALVSPSAAPAAGLAYASWANPAMQGVAARGGLGARYNPLAPPDDSKLSFTGRKGAAQASDLPFDKFTAAFSLSSTLSPALLEPTNVFGAGGIRAAAGAVAAMASGREARAAMEGIETHAKRRLPDADGGFLKLQKWLDAGDLEKTQQMVKTLKQSSPRAIVGYGLDAIKALRFVPSEFGAKLISPRTYANAIVTTPAALLGGMKPFMPSAAWKTFMQASADVALIAGWQYRNQVTHRLSCKSFTEANANAAAATCHAALNCGNLLDKINFMERGEYSVEHPPSPTRPAVTTTSYTVDTEDETRTTRF